MDLLFKCLSACSQQCISYVYRAHDSLITLANLAIPSSISSFYNTVSEPLLYMDG